MPTLVFGHKSPDTDSTGSPLIWAWYLSEIRGTPAEARLLGAPNTEAAFVCKRWGYDEPAIISDVSSDDTVVIVDTNNPAELPASINQANVMLSCILSDTLAFRSPTTTDQDKELAESLAKDLGLDIPAYADELFEAKSDVSAFSDADLIRMDSKEYEVGGKKFRVSVLETTAPQIILDRKASLMASMPGVASEDGVDEVLLFVVDILQEQATLFVPNDTVKTVAEKSFGATVSGDSVILPGIMSRKKQIIPNLAL